MTEDHLWAQSWALEGLNLPVSSQPFLSYWLFSFPPWSRLGFPFQDLLWSLSSFSLMIYPPCWCGRRRDSCAVSTPPPAALVQCKWQISPCTPGPLYQSAGLCSVRANLNSTVLLSRHKLNIILLSQLLGKRRRHDPFPQGVRMCIWNTVCPGHTSARGLKFILASAYPAIAEEGRKSTQGFQFCTCFFLF